MDGWRQAGKQANEREGLLAFKLACSPHVNKFSFTYACEPLYEALATASLRHKRSLTLLESFVASARLVSVVVWPL